MAMPAEGTDRGPSTRTLHGLDRVRHPFFDNRAIWVARALTGGSNFYDAGDPILDDRGQTATSMAGLPAGFIDRLSRSRCPLQSARCHMVSLPLRLFGVPELLGHDTPPPSNEEAQQRRPHCKPRTPRNPEGGRRLLKQVVRLKNSRCPLFPPH
jgi:hypothetical protein